MSTLKLYTTTWINLTHVKSNKRSKSQKKKCGKIPFVTFTIRQN